MNRPIPISGVIITYNVVDTIEPCIAALWQVCEEIVVIDSFSTDGTAEICEKMGVNLISHEWLGYSKTKNLGNEIAKNDWILSIDSDEVLSDDLIKSLNNLKINESFVYALDRLTNYCGKWIYNCGWYPEWKVRLFNKKQVHWQGDFVHETLVIPVGIEQINLEGKLFHYSYKDSEDHFNRINKYAKLAAQERFSRGEKANFIKQWLSPLSRFIRTFIIKKGFLDGKAGFLISWRSAYMVWLRYDLLKKLWQNRL